MKQLIVRVPDELHRSIKTAAAVSDQSMQDIVIEALRTCDVVEEALKKYASDQAS